MAYIEMIHDGVMYYSKDNPDTNKEEVRDNIVGLVSNDIFTTLVLDDGGLLLIHPNVAKQAIFLIRDVEEVENE